MLRAGAVVTARGKELEPAFRSKLERDYAAHLDARKAAGEIRAWWFEAMTFRLGFDCRYTPDFAIQLPDLTIEMIEVKGARRWDGALEKVRTACEMFPFVFRLVTRSKAGAWEIAEVGAPTTRAKSVPGARPGARIRCSRRAEADTSAAPICEGVGCTRRTSTPPFCFQHKDFGRPSSATKERMATLAGKEVTREYALDLIRRG